MAEAEDQEVTDVKAGKSAGPMPRTLKFAIAAAAIGLGYMLAVFLFGSYGLMWTVPVCCVLLGGFISALVGLAERSNRFGPHRRCYVVVLVVMVSTALFLIPALGIMRLLNLHCRTRVALTGGQGALQSWAVDLLARPRGELDPRYEAEEEAHQLPVPESCWSKQVARLKPRKVLIDQFFKDDQESVRLCYGGGFLGHWYVVVGPPGAIPDPKLNDGWPNSPWFRWGDGVYCWITD